jgi:very-short-patch-repair endonuclease
MIPYKLYGNGRDRSYLEIQFENAMKDNGITNWESDYDHGIYNYDFAFPDIKLDVEIDGSTHLQPTVIDKDRRRDEWSKSKGWKVLRFTGKQVKNDIGGCIDMLKGYLLS